MDPLRIDLLGWEAEGTVGELRAALVDLPDDAVVRATSCCCGEGLTAEIPVAGPPKPPPLRRCRPCAGTGTLRRYLGPRISLLDPSAPVHLRVPAGEPCPWCEGEGSLRSRVDAACPKCEGAGWRYDPGPDLPASLDEAMNAPRVPCSTCKAIGFVYRVPF